MMHIDKHPILGSKFENEISFRFDGQTLKTREGQTIAAALMANGIKKLGVSRKLNQPRGLFCASGRCTSCVVTVDGLEHVLSCQTIVEDGMDIYSANSDPD